MIVKLRYVVKRVGRRGKVRFYWERKGHPLTRLPDDLPERAAMAEQLNSRADTVSSTEPLRGTIKWVIARYVASDKFRDLAPGTKRYYLRYLRDIEALGGRLPFKSFTRRAVVDFIDTYSKDHQRRQAAAVLQAVFKRAHYEGLASIDTAARLELRTIKPRERIWTDAEVHRWLAAAAIEDPHMATAFRLLQYTAQRPGDVLAATWPQYSGSAIRLRQQKTKVLLDVPIDPELRDHLDAVQRSPVCLTIVTYRNRPVPYRRFNERFLAIAKRAGVDAQARDLRRTSMVNMAKAGATIAQIASVSGHSIEATQRVLETYLPRNFDLGQAAIARLAEYRTRTKSNAFEKT
jgi:integrase